MSLLYLATRNAHKTAEFREMLGAVYEIRDATTVPNAPEVAETGLTFEANAALKALALSQLVEAPVVADDSGLEVDALHGAPGVRSARYAGENASDADNRTKLLAALQAAGARGKARSARFRCVLVLAQHGVVLTTVDGRVEGVLTAKERGIGGFGYDPLFIPEGACSTFAELPPSAKHAISHRGRAITRLRPLLETLLPPR